jgi:hypothetical protein
VAEQPGRLLVAAGVSEVPTVLVAPMLAERVTCTVLVPVPGRAGCPGGLVPVHGRSDLRRLGGDLGGRGLGPGRGRGRRCPGEALAGLVRGLTERQAGDHVRGSGAEERHEGLAADRVHQDDDAGDHDDGEGEQGTLVLEAHEGFSSETGAGQTEVCRTSTRPTQPTESK